MMKMLASIPHVLQVLQQGRMIILVDDEDRENEGDLVLAAERVTPEHVNFMAKFGRGLICLALEASIAKQLDLSPMVDRNTSRYGTAFTVSIDAKDGATTGISATDRALTIRKAVQRDAKPEDFSRPGHVFPLVARNGGVLVRAGQTEGGVDLARLCGLRPAAVICEIMNDDGTMSRMPQLQRFAQEHGLEICTIADLISYRRQREQLVELVTGAELPTKYGRFSMHVYQSKLDEYLHIALCLGRPNPGLDRAVLRDVPVIVRVHSECLTGDIFGSLRCDCGGQLEQSLRMIAEKGEGVLLYLRQEGRGIGLVNKIRAYKLQDHGLDTVQANQQLGLPVDKRDYGIGAQILAHLGLTRLRILTNNPKKLIALPGYDLEVVEMLALEVRAVEENRHYLKTKRDKMGHRIRNL